MFWFHFLFTCPPPASIFLIHAAKRTGYFQILQYLIVVFFIFLNKVLYFLSHF